MNKKVMELQINFFNSEGKADKLIFIEADGTVRTNYNDLSKHEVAILNRIVGNLDDYTNFILNLWNHAEEEPITEEEIH